LRTLPAGTGDRGAGGLAFTREFIDGLEPLLAGRPVDLDGTS
jgi:hypothetical protein